MANNNVVNATENTEETKVGLRSMVRRSDSLLVPQSQVSQQELDSLSCSLPRIRLSVGTIRATITNLMIALINSKKESTMIYPRGSTFN